MSRCVTGLVAPSVPQKVRTLLPQRHGGHIQQDHLNPLNYSAVKPHISYTKL